MASSKLEINEFGVGYFAIDEVDVAYSEEIDDNVVADYDAGGRLIGLELLNAKKDMSRLQDLIGTAASKSRGKFERPD